MGRRGSTAYLRGYPVSQVALALALPFFAAGVQWLLFPLITPSVWILFYLTLFLSAWLAGFIGGVGSALISTVLVLTLFIGPQANWVIGPNRILPTLLFLGIGLATVKRIINRHGGQIQAEAAPGLGATFSFWLPDADELLSQAGDGERAIAG